MEPIKKVNTMEIEPNHLSCIVTESVSEMMVCAGGEQCLLEPSENFSLWSNGWQFGLGAASIDFQKSTLLFKEKTYEFRWFDLSVSEEEVLSTPEGYSQCSEDSNFQTKNLSEINRGLMVIDSGETDMAVRLKPLISVPIFHSSQPFLTSTSKKLQFRFSATTMAADNSQNNISSSERIKIIDSHLHVWASPQEAAENFPYFPGQEPTLPGNADFLLQCMEEASVDGALIVQPINHKFDHSLVTSVLKKYPSKFVGCCLANPAEDGSGVKQLEDLVLKDGYRAVRFNPYLWPAGQQMTNEIGKRMFSKAGELGVPVGFMCMKGLNLHICEIEKLCTEFPSTVVLLDHLAFCKPPTTEEENLAFFALLRLSRFPQVYVKFSALFRLSRMQFPYQDLSNILSQVVSSFGANRVMWGSDFPFVVPECGYNEAKEAVSLIANQIPLSSSEMEWIMGRTVMQLFQGQWLSS